MANGSYDFQSETCTWRHPHAMAVSEFQELPWCNQLMAVSSTINPRRDNLFKDELEPGSVLERGTSGVNVMEEGKLIGTLGGQFELYINDRTRR